MPKTFLSVALLSFLSTTLFGQIENVKVYEGGKLSKKFINEICRASEKPKVENDIAPFYLEQLINKAAGTYYKDSLQPTASYNWHKVYAPQLQCPSTENFEGGDFLRKVVASGFRDFANIVGPSNRLSLNLQFKDPSDSLTIREYINYKRISLEKKHNDKRFEFQQNEEWRNIMFFYFLFSEFSIN